MYSIFNACTCYNNARNFKFNPIVTCPSDTYLWWLCELPCYINTVWCLTPSCSFPPIDKTEAKVNHTVTMTEPISRGTGEDNSSDSSAQPHGMSEMNGSRKVGNETHRGMKSRHLTMIGMYCNYSDTVSVV